jgi:branched-chain amino acid transport system ATP-binding protein
MLGENNENGPLLELEEASKSFGGLIAVTGVNLEVMPEELVSIIGTNGAGKTTLLNMIGGSLSLTRGEVRFRGMRINGLPAHRICSMGIGRTFQDDQIFNNMTVIDNVMVGAERGRGVGVLRVMGGLESAKKEERQITERALETLSLVGLAEKARMLPSSLTVKERKLLGIARALATEPRLLLLDEPVAGLNAEEINEVSNFILSLLENGMTILLIEHRMEMVMSISHRVIVLNFGTIIADDIPSEIQEDKKVIAAYLGDGLL